MRSQLIRPRVSVQAAPVWDFGFPTAAAAASSALALTCSVGTTPSSPPTVSGSCFRCNNRYPSGTVSSDCRSTRRFRTHLNNIHPTSCIQRLDSCSSVRCRRRSSTDSVERHTNRPDNTVYYPNRYSADCSLYSCSGMRAQSVCWLDWRWHRGGSSADRNTRPCP